MPWTGESEIKLQANYILRLDNIISITFWNLIWACRYLDCQNHRLAEQLSQVEPGFVYLQGWEPHNICGQPVPVDDHPHSILSLDTTEIPLSDKSGSVRVGIRDPWHRLSENQQDLWCHLFPTHPEWVGRISLHLGLEQGGCSLPVSLGFQTFNCAQGRVDATQTFSTPCCPVEKGQQSEVPPSCIWQTSLCKAMLAPVPLSWCQRLWPGGSLSLLL